MPEGLHGQSSAGRAGQRHMPRLGRRADDGAPARPQTAPMPAIRNVDLGEVALTTTLLSLYVGARGTARALGVLHGLIARESAPV